MPRERFLNLDASARARLLDVAVRHFAEHGLEGASLNEILTEAAMSKGSYYYYFDDKDDLFATTLESGIDAALARVPLPRFDALTAEEFWPTVERFIGAWSTAFDPSSDFFQMALKLTDAQRQNPRFAPVFAKAQDLYRALITPGQRLDCIRRDLPVDVLVRLLEANDAVLDSIFLATKGKGTRARLAKHVELVFDTFKRLLLAEAPSDKPRRPRG